MGRQSIRDEIVWLPYTSLDHLILAALALEDNSSVTHLPAQASIIQWIHTNFDSTGPSRRLQTIATNQRNESITKPLRIYESQICSAAASIARDVMTYFKSKLHAFYLIRSQPRVLFGIRYRVIVGKAKE
jgi:hypothetical protein